MSSPKGAASISVLQLPSPNVVVGDTMRDSLGVATPLSVIAYDANNAKLADITALFFISDSSHTAHLNGGSVLIGDKLGSVQLVGQVGGLQTPPVLVPVTVAPTKFAGVPIKPDTALFVPISTDSATSVGSFALAATLKGDTTAALSFVVKYTLSKAPQTKPGSPPAVYLSDIPGHISAVDTTDATGATRSLVVNSLYLADPKLLVDGADTAVVIISTSYKGVPVSGSPITVVLPLKASFPVK
ncbi:MAG TPA: hypothetical protein VK636_20245 [Gemmatimonadaceae bacterium]|nr:hypothetical protein [Gemmatimonadaceae bacterium]